MIELFRNVPEFSLFKSDVALWETTLTDEAHAIVSGCCILRVARNFSYRNCRPRLLQCNSAPRGYSYWKTHLRNSEPPSQVKELDPDPGAGV